MTEPKKLSREWRMELTPKERLIEGRNGVLLVAAALSQHISGQARLEESDMGLLRDELVRSQAQLAQGIWPEDYQ